MKKFLSTLLVLGVVLSTVLSADLTRVEVGAGAWIQTPAGDMQVGQISDETEEAKAYVWALIKHPVPVIPNLRIEYTNVISSNKITSLEITQYDLVPYYNILDNTGWITIDLGLDFKVINATEEISGNQTDSTVLPMGYARTRFQLPLSGLAAEADVKYISFSDNTAYDVRAKLDYTFTSFPVLEPAIEIGYRVQKFETDELLGYTMNMEFEGVYLGLMVRF